ncbi:hypothetical protein Zmor_013064 [Zophobas morio]|uniref:Uncharacterized protein n=1 Tax=Zophobas morio TaxID=2755281 RepID=A0AA38IH34_9CUCU|nr:hypothetical protein Zmor_013064 [Zophobas morio]
MDDEISVEVASTTLEAISGTQIAVVKSKPELSASTVVEELRLRSKSKTNVPLVPKLSCERLTINDSQDPSYRHLQLPYYVVCRQRYTKAATKQRLQFLKEVRKQEISQSRALSGVRIHREFLNPVITPPKAEDVINLTPKQKFKIQQLLRD